MKILAIDDNNVALLNLKAIIEIAFPNSVLATATDGRAGIELAVTNDPDVILLDIFMPEMDGFEVCNQLKQDEKTSNIPVVFLTSLKDDKESRLKALESGAEGFLSKPIDQTELIAMLRAMAKIKIAGQHRKNEKEHLARLVAERTRKLEQSQIESLNLLKELKTEIDVRRKIEKSLRESEDRLKRAELASKLGNWELYLDTRTMIASEGALNLYGVEKGNFDYELAKAVPLPEYRNLLDLAMKNLIEKDEPYDVEFKIKRIADHEIKDIHSLAIFDKEKRIVFGVIQDITERKLMETQIHESEQHYRTLVETSPDAIIIVDSSGLVQYASHRAYEIFGIDDNNEDGVKGSSFLKWVVPEMHETILSRFRNILSGEIIPETSEYKLLKKDGSIFWADIHGSILRTSEGKIKGLLMICHDVTQRKLAENAQIESINLFQGLFNASPDAIILTDPYNPDVSWPIIDCNKSACLMNGYEREELVGQTIDILNATLDSGETRTQYFEDLRKKGTLHVETYHRHKDGHIFPVEVLTSIVTLGGRELVLGIDRDITEKKQMLDNLIAAKESAEESDRLKSAFLANMSHEIRTPLNSIIGFSELMTDPDFDASQQSQFARIINTSGNNLLSIITDIMDISKIESGQVQVNKRLFSVNSLIISIQKEYRFKAEEKGIEFVLDIKTAEEEIFVESDETKVRQVLINFVANAMKFTKEGFIAIGAGVTGDAIQFHVKDTGIGIAKDFHDKIFERFRQVESSYTRKYGGNGLGLAISKSLVELLGGKIWLESEQGKGSTFYFTIPKK